MIFEGWLKVSAPGSAPNSSQRDFPSLFPRHEVAWEEGKVRFSLRSPCQDLSGRPPDSEDHRTEDPTRSLFRVKV